MTNRQSIVIGIDPGYDRCGFGVIQGSGMDWKCLAHGVINTSKEDSLSDRLAEIACDFEGLLERFDPSLVVIEELFFAQSTTTALKVAEARGVIRMLAARSGILVSEVKPNEVKLGLTGYGKADKKQMQEMVKVTLGLSKVPTPDDAADALAVAIVGASRLLHG